MQKSFKILLLAAAAIGLGFAAGFTAGGGSFSFTEPPESALVELMWDTREEIKEQYYRPGEISDEELLYGATRGMVEAVGDPYTSFFTPQETQQFLEDARGFYEGIGAEIGFRDRMLTIIAPLPESPALRGGIKAGDRILAVDEEPTEGMSLEEAVARIRGPAESTVTLTIFREGFDEPRDFEITRETIDLPEIEVVRRDDGVMVIKLFNFVEEAPGEFRKLVPGILKDPPKGIVLDLRNNPGGFLEGSVAIAGWFLEEGVPVVIERERGREDMVLRSEGPGSLGMMPLVVLVNQGTASAGEILAGALHEQLNAPLLGSQTFGKGTVQEFSRLRHGAALKVTIGEWLTSEGNVIQDKGLTPTVTVEDNEETEQDEVMEEAVSQLPIAK